MEFEREIERGTTGTCPHCGDEQYVRENFQLEGDAVFFGCVCNNCASQFKETFVLVAQDWEIER